MGGGGEGEREFVRGGCRERGSVFREIREGEFVPRDWADHILIAVGLADTLGNVL